MRRRHDGQGEGLERGGGFWGSHLPQQEDVLEGELPLEPDEQPAEAEAQRAAVLGVWRRHTSGR